MSFSLDHGRPLAPLTTLGLGGPAKHFVEARERSELLDALRWAQGNSEWVGILGGGSNLVVSDAGVEGLVVRMATRGIELAREHDAVLLTAQAGEPWEDVVELSLREELSGLECLIGIPGSTGATPIQNVGAYGQEVSDTIREVEVLDRHTLELSWWPRERCGFAYRDSYFKRDPARYVVLAVRFALSPKGAPTLRYAELARALAGKSTPSLREVASTVRALRAKKSMVLDPQDENRRSAGSFFTNPIVTADEAVRVRELAVRLGLVTRSEEVPCFEAGEGLKKLAAGWLIERAGIAKGLRRGQVGISSKHALALVHHGGGSTHELLSLASDVQQAVLRVFGVQLELEPVRWGF